MLIIFAVKHLVQMKYSYTYQEVQANSLEQPSIFVDISKKQYHLNVNTVPYKGFRANQKKNLFLLYESWNIILYTKNPIGKNRFDILFIEINKEDPKNTKHKSSHKIVLPDP